MKRLVDILGSTLALIVLAPVFLAVAIMQRSGGQGPVFFRQTRIGRDRRPFRIFKFRTMVADAERLGPKVTVGNDPRITRLGRFLRRTKLDELPQLFNVLRGEMSLVGPRPEIPELVEHYTSDELRIFSVRPGITSPASLFYRKEEELVRGEDAMRQHREVLIHRKLAYDLNYLDDRSLAYDLKLIAITATYALGRLAEVLTGPLLRRRQGVIALSVFLTCSLAYYAAFLLRFDGIIPETELVRFARTWPLVMVFYFGWLAAFRMFSGYWQYISFEDLIELLKAIGLATITHALFVRLFLAESYPDGIAPITGMLSLLSLGALRVTMRLWRAAAKRPPSASDLPVLILGDGPEAALILRDINSGRRGGLRPVGLLAEQGIAGMRFCGVPVLGILSDLGSILDRTEIAKVINTDHDIDRSRLREIAHICREHQVPLLKVPTPHEVIAGEVHVNHLREVHIEDLLGRVPVEISNANVRADLAGQTVLVTGAGGSIGSELCRQIAPCAPAALLLLELSEYQLYEISMELADRRVPTRVVPLIGDIRNEARIHDIFRLYRPTRVFHAAAYKHVPLMEESPLACIENNVLGTRVLARAAEELGVEGFLMISTDKAVRPSSVMGASKRAAEKLLLERAPARTRFNVVRFGNVLGSSGSVIPRFKRQIAEGGPVTVTHPDVTRYFMSIPEAVQLVLQAGTMARGGEIFILDMGHPVRILDLARDLIVLSGLVPGEDIEIHFTGLRPGEKLYEELITDGEGIVRTEHEKIRVQKNREAGDLSEVDAMTDGLTQAVDDGDVDRALEILQRLVPDYVPGLGAAVKT